MWDFAASLLCHKIAQNVTNVSLLGIRYNYHKDRWSNNINRFGKIVRRILLFIAPITALGVLNDSNSPSDNPEFIALSWLGIFVVSIYYEINDRRNNTK